MLRSDLRAECTELADEVQMVRSWVRTLRRRAEQKKAFTDSVLDEVERLHAAIARGRALCDRLDAASGPYWPSTQFREALDLEETRP